LGNLQIVGYAGRTVNQADCDNGIGDKKRQTPFDACLSDVMSIETTDQKNVSMF
jgi:hypothetical protein